MSAKHTPAPWYVIDRTSEHNGDTTGTFDISTTVDYNYGGKWIGDTKPYGGKGFTDKETAKANAHLIAAAPELFDVLKAMLDEHPEAFPFKYRVQAREVIAKATGKKEESK